MVGTCEACGRAARCHRDRRWPGYLGGRYCTENVHLLCNDCHFEKTEIERDMRHLDFSRLDRWLYLALPDASPVGAGEHFSFMAHFYANCDD